MSLLKEYYRVLNGPYNIMPLVRPTHSNPEAVKILNTYSKEKIDKMVALARGNLQRPESEVPSGVEVVQRPGLNPTMRNEAGERVM